MALIGGGAAVMQSCGSDNSVPELKGIVHYVLFWLKEDLTEQQVKDFTAFFEDLKRIPGIKSLSYGGPAASHPRPVVDNSFSYNLIVVFDSLKELGVYENHPIHLEAIEKYSSNWTKVVVHDSVC